MKHEPQFCFDSEKGLSTCVIKVNNKTFTGVAQCAERDRDMMNEKTGCEIAYHRTVIKLLKDRENELKIKLSALNEYYFSMNTSKWFNPTSYEARRLNNHMLIIQEDIDMTKKMIEEERKYLNQYMSDKAKFYKKIRNNRKVKSEQ